MLGCRLVGKAVIVGRRWFDIYFLWVLLLVSFRVFKGLVSREGFSGFRVWKFGSVRWGSVFF